MKITQFCIRKCCRHLGVERTEREGNATCFSFYCSEDYCSYKESSLLKRLFVRLLDTLQGKSV